MAAVGFAGAPARSEERRFSRFSICRRIEIASCRVLTDMSMCYEIAGVGWEGNHNFYNNLMPDVTWSAPPISYIDVTGSKIELP